MIWKTKQYNPKSQFFLSFIWSKYSVREKKIFQYQGGLKAETEIFHKIEIKEL